MDITEEQIFLQTLIELLNDEEKHNLADMLKQCKLEFEQTNEFTKKTWQHKEYIVIKCPIRLKKQ